MKYLLMKKYENGETALSIIEDPLELYKSGQFREDNGDKLFQIGDEVRVELNIKVKSKTTFRELPASSAFRLQSGTIMNGDQGVGDTRGY